MNLRSALALCAGVVLTTLGTIPAYGESIPPGPGINLLQNASFENPEGPSFYWHQNNWSHNEVEFALDKENPHSGAQSQRITLRKVTGGIASLQFGTPPLPVRPGMSVQLRFWTRGTPNTKPVDVTLGQPGAPYAVYFFAQISLLKDWTENVFTFTLPPNTDAHSTALKFDLREENTFWLDDVSLTEMPVQEGGVPLVGNQLRNGSFEVGRDHWFATFRESRFPEVNAADEANAAANIVARPDPDAPDGRQVLSWEVFPACRAALTSAYFHLRYGHPVSIRFWMKTSAVGKRFDVNLGQGKFPNQINEHVEFTPAKPGWNFYHAIVTPKPSNAGLYYLEFSTGAAGKYALDGVSVVEGETDEQVFTARQNEVGWGISGDAPAGNLFFVADAIHFPLVVSISDKRQEVPVHLRLVDYREAELRSWNVTVPVDEKGHGQTDVAFPSDRLGGFKVEAFVDRKAEGIPDDDLLYSVVPHLKPLAAAQDSYFGAHVSMTPYNLAIAERLGFRWLRLNPPLSTKWMVVERKQGTFDLDTRGVARAHERGFQVLGSLNTTPPFYADGDPAKVRSASWYNSYPPADWNAWRVYVQKTVAAFAPYVQAWEVWNEPDGSFMQVKSGTDKPALYLRMAQETRQALDEASLHTYLIGNVVANIDRPFTLAELRLGGGKEVDALSFHLYIEDRGPEEKQPPLAPQIAQMRAFPNRSGETPDVWVTESGIWIAEGRSWLGSAEIPTSIVTTMTDAANTVSRNLAGFKAMGVRRYFDYAALAHPAGGIVYRDECCGIIDVSGIPHAGGAAYAASVYFLEDAQALGLETKATEGGEVTIARFKKTDGPVTVVWARHPVQLGQVPGVDWKKASGFDLMGNSIALSADLPVTLDPIYLVGRDDPATPR